MKTKLLISTAVLAATIALAVGAPQQAHAEDCLLDRDNDGNVDAGSTDNDGGADSLGQDISLACGVGASTTGPRAVALGASASAQRDGTAIGFSANASENSVALGYDASATASGAVAIGSPTSNIGVMANGIQSIAIGTGTRVFADYAIIIGGDLNGDSLGAQASSTGNIAIGADSSALGINSIAIGQNSATLRDNSFAVGSEFNERFVTNVQDGIRDTDAVNLRQLNSALAGISQFSGIAIDVSGGNGPTASGFDALAIGGLANADGSETTAIGAMSGALGEKATAVGAISTATGDFSSAFGGSSAEGRASVALGSGARSVGESSVALGNEAISNAAESVAIGLRSVADEANTISVGSIGNRRRITNVAAGINPTDAVNLAQLQQATTAGAAFVEVNASGTGPQAGGSNAVAIGQGVSAQGSDSVAIGSDTGIGFTLASGTGAVAVGTRAQAQGENSVAIGSGSLALNDNVVSVGRQGGERRITNVAAGFEDTDAVNKAQLDAVAAAAGSAFVDVNGAGGSAGAGGINGIAIGANAAANGAGSIAIGGDAQGFTNATRVDGEGSIAIGSRVSAAFGARAVALGADASISGDNAIAIGADASAAQGSVSLGQLSTTFVAKATALGQSAFVSGARSVAIGADSAALEEDVVSFGRSGSERRLVNVANGTALTDAVNLGQLNSAVANISVGGNPFVSVQASGNAAPAVTNGNGALAVGVNALASAGNASAYGAGSSASGGDATAVGFGAGAAGTAASAFGNGASASASTSTAVGRQANASGGSATAIGNASAASQNVATSVGAAASAGGVGATAVGRSANASGVFATALGSEATASFNRSTAVGDGATTSAAREVALGGTGSSVRIGDIDASTAAQVGPVDAVTVDANGVLGRQSVATAASVDNVRVSMNALAQVTEGQFNQLESTVLALDGRVAGVEFALEDLDQRTSGGIAAAMALGGQMVVPDSSVSFSLNASTYQGEQGFAGSVAARVAERVYISAGIAGSSAPDSTGGRVGVAFGF